MEKATALSFQQHAKYADNRKAMPQGYLSSVTLINQQQIRLQFDCEFQCFRFSRIEIGLKALCRRPIANFGDAKPVCFDRVSPWRIRTSISQLVGHRCWNDDIAIKRREKIQLVDCSEADDRRAIADNDHSSPNLRNVAKSCSKSSMVGRYSGIFRFLRSSWKAGFVIRAN
jgi:hypothetical protein